MRLINFHKCGVNRLGLLMGDQVLDVNRALQVKYEREADPDASRRANFEAPAEMQAFIASGEKSLQAAIEMRDWVESFGKNHDQEELTKLCVILSTDAIDIAPPLTHPGKIICIGLNYKDHAIEGGDPIPDYPIYFPKYSNCIIGPGDNIVIPKVTDMVDYEVEMAFIIGKPGRHIDKTKAMEYVFGYTIANDVSGREYQRRSSQWLAGKAFDTFLPMGPHIVTSDELTDPYNLSISCKVNDEVRQNSSTAQMIFTIPDIIQDLSAIMTLEPGDIIITGTPPGVGSAHKPPKWLRPGDVVTLEIEGIGVMQNPVIAE